MQQSVNVIAAAGRAIQRRQNEQVMFLVAGSHTKEQPSAPREPSSVTTTPSPLPVVTVPATLSSVMDCIKGAESGNYAESSHPSSGSGAYQFTPSTWASWSARAGFPGYAYAYQAPAGVQDAVTAFTLSNGGAHNWDMKYGNDPCTAGLP